MTTIPTECKYVYLSSSTEDPSDVSLQKIYLTKTSDLELSPALQSTTLRLLFVLGDTVRHFKSKPLYRLDSLVLRNFSGNGLLDLGTKPTSFVEPYIFQPFNRIGVKMVLVLDQYYTGTYRQNIFWNMSYLLHSLEVGTSVLSSHQIQEIEL